MILSEEVDNENIKKNIVFRIENAPQKNCLETAMFLLFLFSYMLNYKNTKKEDLEYEFYKNNKDSLNKINYKAIDHTISNDISENGVFLNVKEYSKLKSRKINFKYLVNNISGIRISYYDKNHRKKTENLINVKKYNQKKGVLVFQINDFISKKLSARGKGHLEIYYPASIFDCSNFRQKTKNKRDFLKTLEESIEETY